MENQKRKCNEEMVITKKIKQEFVIEEKEKVICIMLKYFLRELQNGETKPCEICNPAEKCHFQILKELSRLSNFSLENVFPKMLKNSFFRKSWETTFNRQLTQEDVECCQSANLFSNPGNERLVLLKKLSKQIPEFQNCFGNLFREDSFPMSLDNLFIFYGTTGSGKSWLINTFLHRWYVEGAIPKFSLDSNNRLCFPIHKYPVLIKFVKGNQKSIQILHTGSKGSFSSFIPDCDLLFMDGINSCFSSSDKPLVTFLVPILKDEYSFMEGLQLLEVASSATIPKELVKDKKCYFFQIDWPYCFQINAMKIEHELGIKFFQTFQIIKNSHRMANATIGSCLIKNEDAQVLQLFSWFDLMPNYIWTRLCEEIKEITLFLKPFDDLIWLKHVIEKKKSTNSKMQQLLEICQELCFLEKFGQEGWALKLPEIDSDEKAMQEIAKLIKKNEFFDFELFSLFFKEEFEKVKLLN